MSFSKLEMCENLPIQAMDSILLAIKNENTEEVLQKLDDYITNFGKDVFIENYNQYDAFQKYFNCQDDSMPSTLLGVVIMFNKNSIKIVEKLMAIGVDMTKGSIAKNNKTDSPFACHL